MSIPKKNIVPNHQRIKTEEERHQVAITLTPLSFRIIRKIQEDTGETRSQLIHRLIVSENARKEGQQEGNDEMRERMAELLAVG